MHQERCIACGRCVNFWQDRTTDGKPFGHLRIVIFNSGSQAGAMGATTANSIDDDPLCQKGQPNCVAARVRDSRTNN